MTSDRRFLSLSDIDRLRAFAAKGRAEAATVRRFLELSAGVARPSDLATPRATARRVAARHGLKHSAVTRFA